MMLLMTAAVQSPRDDATVERDGLVKVKGQDW